MSAWKSIETAPKDNVILLTDGGYCVSGFWHVNSWMIGWSTDIFHITIKIAPTHWMPLPDPPVKL